MTRENAPVETLSTAGETDGGGALQPELFVGIAGPVSTTELHLRAREVVEQFGAVPGGAKRIVIAHPAAGSGFGAEFGGDADADFVRSIDFGDDPREEAPATSNGHSAGDRRAHALSFLAYPMPAGGESASPWATASAAQRALAALVLQQGARAAVLLSADLTSLDARTIEDLVSPIVEGQVDLALPCYRESRYDGLLNAGILSPLMRALYGCRVRYPLGPDLGMSPKMAARLAQPPAARAHAADTAAVTWPAAAAAGSDLRVAQVRLAVTHAPRTDGLELSAVIAELVGSAFAEMDRSAAHWQRVRGSQPIVTSGVVAGQAAGPGVGQGSAEPVPDTHSMLASFLLGARSLREVWGLILPPATLLELKHLTQLPAELFRMPDELWVRIVYDFALAYRLRTISRGHLLGALTPLYLGWTASWVGEVAALSEPAVEARIERLARAYEEGKPYLVRRWRWPDRFNP